MPGRHGSLGGRGPGWFQGHRGCQGCAERRGLAAAGCGHRPVPAGLPGLLWGPAPEPPSPAAGEGGKVGGKGLQDVGRGHWGQESRAGGFWGMQVFLEEPGAGRSSSSTCPAVPSPPCGFQFRAQRIYKATKWGQFSLKPLACPTWHFQDDPTAGEGQKCLFEHQDPQFFSIPSPLQTVLVFNPCLAATVVRDVASVPWSCTHIPALRDAEHRQGWSRGEQG